jgi:hypothetical protein
MTFENHKLVTAHHSIACVVDSTSMFSTHISIKIRYIKDPSVRKHTDATSKSIVCLMTHLWFPVKRERVKAVAPPFSYRW